MTGKKFEVDDEGFKNQMSEMGLWRLAQEIVTNEFDEKKHGVTKVEALIYGDTDGTIKIIVKGNGLGFRDIKEIYTLYGDSYKRVDSEVAGRYNLGDKQFLSVAEYAVVKSNEHIVSFGSFGRKETINPNPIKGTEISGNFKRDITDDEFDNIIVELKKVAVPEGIEYTINGDLVEPREIIKSFKTILRTPVASGKNQKLVDVNRECEIRLYPLLDGEEPMIMELGVQINKFKERNLDWHVDIRQKVPIPTSRDMVSPKYLTDLYSKLLDNTLDLLEGEGLEGDWINDGLKKSSEQGVRDFLIKKHGTDKIMIESDNDYRANEKAQMQGYKVIPQVFSREIMKNIGTKTGVVKYAGKEFGTNFGADSKPVEPNPEMLRFAEIVKRIGKYVLHREITVTFSRCRECDESATWSGNNMNFNVSKIRRGTKGFSEVTDNLLGIIIHELAHGYDRTDCGQYAHLKMDYITALQVVGARVGMKGLEYFLKPEVLAK